MVLPPQPRWGRWYLHVTVSLLSGSLEVSARLTSADGFELLVKVLEANKALFAKAAATKSLAKADRSATSLRRGRTDQQSRICRRR
jgi:hypothetical protein